MSDADEKAETLYDKLVEQTGLEQEDDESAEDFKARLVKYFADTFPNTEEGNAKFDELDDEISDWVNSATEVASANRGARNKKRLPQIAGLEEDAAEEKPKRGRAGAEKGKSAGKAKKEKAEPAGRGPEDNRFFKVGSFLAKKPDMTADALVKETAKLGYSEKSVRRVHYLFGKVYDTLKAHGKIVD